MGKDNQVIVKEEVIMVDKAELTKDELKKV